MTSRLLGRIAVIPFYHQVSIGDYEDTMVPEWDSSSLEAGYSASDTRLLVATCNDQDGHVIVDLRDGGKDASYGNVLFDGSLRIDSQTLTVGSVTTDPSRVLFFPRPGTWKVTVYVAPARQARHITVVVEDYEDPDMPDAPWMEV